MTFSVNTFETNPGEGNLSFAFHEKLNEGQELYFIAQFPSDTIEAKSFAESVFGAIVDYFEESPIKDPYDLFEESLKMANAEMQKRKKQIKDIPEIVVAFFDFHNLYISQSGESEVYLIREGVLSQITEVPEKNLLFSNILSGQVSVHDVLIICTNRLLRVLTAHQLVDIFNFHDFGESISLLKQELRSKTDADMLVSIIGIGKQSERPKKPSLLSRVIPQKKSDPHGELVTYATNQHTEALSSEKDDDIIQTEIETTQSEEFQNEPVISESETLEPFEENIAPYEDMSSPNEEEDEKHISIKEDQNHFSHLNILEKTNEISRVPDKKRRNIKLQITSWIKAIRSSKQTALFVAIGVFILFAGIVTFKIILMNQSEAEEALNQKLSTARNAIQRSNELLFQGDRKGANELLTSAEKLVTEVFNSSFEELRSQAKFLKADIETKKLQAENATNANPQLIANLGAKQSNLLALGFEELRGNFFVYDATSLFKTIRNIVENGLNITTQEALIASTTRDEQDTILFLTSTPRIIEYKNGIITPMNTADKNWQSGVDIDSYGSRYVYVLDPIQNQIWKYERRRSDYSEGIAYNKTANLSQAVSMAIDGNIFVLSDDGTIQKIFRGDLVEYEFRDLPSTPFSGKDLKLFTRTDSDLLYILDPNNRRILIFQKGDRFATYKKQVIFQNISDAVDFYIMESGQKANLLTKDKIYEFDL